MDTVLRIAKKELTNYFSSPVAFLFLGVFLAINLFLFFWVSQFFARNISDVRPLFEWMPLLLIFLVSALTMRMWSEERRSGTVEFLMTLPVSTPQLVFGKMLACMALITISLALTIPIPISVSMLGDLDWGPVIGGYIASIFVAGCYTAIGLYISAQNSNQIISLIVSVLVCLALYLLGSPLLISFVGNDGVALLQALGTSSRFESITRGVLDLRDLFYYVSLMGIFVSLNIFSLERIRWENHPTISNTTQLWRKITLLVCLNFLVGNFWLSSVHSARIDLTESQMYSISQTSRNYLENLTEPLLLRGYFSERTHPLLAPLVPQLEDLLREYAIVSRGKVRSEFIDPKENPELEEEASQKYGIKPVPFQISDKYDVSLVNSYFDILISYGDQYEVINFRDLIDIRMAGEGDIEVQLRNPEYDITRSIKKVLFGFRSLESLFETLPKPITFEGYISREDLLPPELKELRNSVVKTVNELSELADGKLQVDIKDPEEGGAQYIQELQQKYGITPLRTLLSMQPFFFSAVLSTEGKSITLPIPNGEDFSSEYVRRTLESGLKRLAPGFVRTIGVATATAPTPDQFSAQQNRKDFFILQEVLQQEYDVEPVTLESGTVGEAIDLLLILAPESLSQKAVFAVDQFVMKGGTVAIATSPFQIARTQTELKAEKKPSGLEDWLESIGISFVNSFVLDEQNEGYPVPVQREIGGGFTVQEIQKVSYPLFVDIRASGMNQDSLITKGLGQVTLNWGSPITIAEEKLQSHEITRLLESSDDSWTADLDSLIPDQALYGPLGFPTGEKKPHLLAASIEGQFTSFFAGKESPLLKSDTPEKKADTDSTIVSGVLEKSPKSARVIVFGSNEFLSDQTLQMSLGSGTSRYLNSLQLVQNAVDWSLEDRGLLSIRSRGHFSRTLEPLDHGAQLRWEYGNYIAALLMLLLTFISYRNLREKKRLRQKHLLDSLS
jgi:ABC-2 type transport system permease protein